MTLPKAIVFLGGGAAEVELLQAFRAHDIRVILVDRNNAAPGREAADEFVNLSVTDVAGIRTALQALQSRYRFVAGYGIVDYMFDTLGELAGILGHSPNGSEIYGEFTNKLKTKARLEKCGIRQPRTLGCGRRCEEDLLNQIVAGSLSDTVVVKAGDQCNSEGVRIVQISDRGSLREAVNQAIGLSGEFFCEEFVGGRLHNLDLIMSDADPLLVAITDRYRLADGVTSVAGLQQRPGHHPLHATFVRLAGRLREAFCDYMGPLTADILVADGEPSVLEVSPHLHTPKLQGLRDARILALWPSILAGEAPQTQCLEEGTAASAWLRIYDDVEGCEDYFEPAWISGVESFEVPREFGSHALRRILYLRADAAALLRRRLESFIDERAAGLRADLRLERLASVFP